MATPTKFTITAAGSEGKSKLTAFDNALLKAKVGNVNLLRVSSILPPNCTYVENLEIPPGSLVPIAYGSIVSDVPGDLIAAAVAVGIGDSGALGVIMELSGKFSKQEAEARITKMVEEAFEVRGMKLNRIMIASAEHKVEKIGCAFAAVPMWY